MTAYNARPYVATAVDSVLAQTFSDFEIVFVEDASDDGTSAVLDRYDDDRLRIIDNDRRQGFAASLNRGLAECSGEFVARMDADDRAHPDRLERQLSILDDRPGIDLLGGHARVVDCDGRPIGYYDYPETDLEIRWTALFKCPFGHPTVMFRRDLLDALDQWYDESFPIAEDYELWTRMIRHTRAANLPDPLIDYRRHEDSISDRYSDQLGEYHMRTVRHAISDFLPGVSITESEVAQLVARFYKGSAFVDGDVRSRVDLAAPYLRLFDAFARRHEGDPGLRSVERAVLSDLTPALLTTEFGWVELELLLEILRRRPDWPLDRLRHVLSVRLRSLGARPSR